MKKLFVIIILMIACGCSPSESTLESTETDYSSATISGYVTAIQDGKFLVVDNRPQYIEEGEKEHFDAIWFSSKEKVERVEIGDYVHAWGSAEFLSYPKQTEVTKIVIGQYDKKDTNLTIKQVIQQAVSEIESVTGEQYYSPILTKIYYEQQTENWIVNFQNNNLNESDINIQIKDS